jgi:hypothetical protein
MDDQADITLGGEQRLASMQTHAYPYRAAFQPTLTVGRRRQCVRRPRESNEERITFGPHLDTVVGGKRRSQYAPVLRKHFRIAVAEFVQQTRRPLDIRKQKGNRTRGQQ